MHGPYEKPLMKRGEVARRLIAEGEDPHRMLAVVVWPGRDWAEDAACTRLASCLCCFGEGRCDVCGSTGLAISA